MPATLEAPAAAAPAAIAPTPLTSSETSPPPPVSTIPRSKGFDRAFTDLRSRATGKSEAPVETVTKERIPAEKEIEKKDIEIDTLNKQCNSLSTDMKDS